MEPGSWALFSAKALAMGKIITGVGWRSCVALLLSVAALTVLFSTIAFNPRVVLTVNTDPSPEPGCEYTVRARLKGALPWHRAKWLSGSWSSSRNGDYFPPLDVSADELLDYWGSDVVSARGVTAHRTFAPSRPGRYVVTEIFRYRLPSGEKGSEQVSVHCTAGG
jgi:hypothetical protein